MDPRQTRTISDVRKKELCGLALYIMTDLPTAVKGHLSLAQELQNRILSVAKTTDENSYLTDVVCYLIEKSKGAEIQVLYKGKVLSREDLFRDHGLFLNLTNKKA